MDISINWCYLHFQTVLTALADSALGVSILGPAVTGEDAGNQGKDSEGRETHYELLFSRLSLTGSE